MKCVRNEHFSKSLHERAFSQLIPVAGTQIPEPDPVTFCVVATVTVTVTRHAVTVTVTVRTHSLTDTSHGVTFVYKITLIYVEVYNIRTRCLELLEQFHNETKSRFSKFLDRRDTIIGTLKISACNNRPSSLMK